jgi:hypothetical protein
MSAWLPTMRCHSDGCSATVTGFSNHHRAEGEVFIIPLWQQQLFDIVHPITAAKRWLFFYIAVAQQP